jgi:hypothetical protein
MIYFNGSFFPESQIERIASVQTDCGGRKAWGYRLITLDGRQSESVSGPERMRVVPNHSKIDALVVTLYADGTWEQERYPVVAWRVDELGDDDAAPVLPIPLVSNQAFCLHHRGRCWIPHDADFDSVDAALEGLRQRLEPKASQ